MLFRSTREERSLLDDIQADAEAATDAAADSDVSSDRDGAGEARTG